MEIVRDKMLTKNFRAGEMACRCGRAACDAAPPDMGFMGRLQSLRELAGPLTINSGCRCEFWNKLQGGAPHSQHLLGKAADLAVRDLAQRGQLIRLGYQVGMRGFGLGATFLHVDDRAGPCATWTYPISR